MRKLAVVTLVFALLSIPQYAGAEDEIVTDRPDVAESSETVGFGRFQVEVGLDFETDETSAGRNNAFRTPFKLRFGIIDPLEVHVESDGFAFDRLKQDAASDDDDAGFSDMDFGLKLHILDQKKLLPSVGLLLAVTTPVGTSPATDDIYSWLPTLAMDWGVGDAWGIGSNVGVTIPMSGRSTNNDAIRYALAVGRTFAPAIPSLRAFVEIFGESEFGGETALSADGGFSWLATPTLQFDLAVRFGITKAAGDFGGGAGVSFKI